MRDYEDKFKRPQPVGIVKKRPNPSEASDAVPVRNDDEYEHHRHVV
jgi:hypothetical protein